MSESISSTLNTTATTRKRRKSSSFQDLQLFIADIEVLQSFKVFCTDKTSFLVSLKKPQVDLIKQNVKSIFLRFCSYEPSKTIQKDYLPKEVDILINDCVLYLESKNSKEKQWKTPVDITNKCRAVTTRNANKFEINLNNCRKLINSGYGIEVILAKKLTINETINLLKSELYIRKTNETLKIIKNSCSGFEDIQCDVIKVPLTCPVTKTIIKIPLVGSKCKHVACFEAQTFLEMHLNKQEWICPVCYNLIRKNELLRDPLIEDILFSTQRTVEQIEFDQLGNFKIPEPEKTKPKNRRSNVDLEFVTLDDEPDQFVASQQPLITPKLEKINFNIDDQKINPITRINNSTQNILESLDLLASAMTNIRYIKNNNSTMRSCTVTSSSSTNQNRVIDVIELSSDDENDQASIICLDSELDSVSSEIANNDSQSDHNSHSDSDSDRSSTYLFFNRPQKTARRSHSFFDHSTANENTDSSDDERFHLNDNAESDHTELNSDSDDNDSNINSNINSGRRNRQAILNSFNGDSTELDESNHSSQSSNSSNNSNSSSSSTNSSKSSNSNSSLSSLSTNSSKSNSTNQNFNASSASSSSLLQSRDSLRRRRKRRRLDYEF